MGAARPHREVSFRRRCSLACAITASAQYASYRFDHWTTDDGLHGKIVPSPSNYQSGEMKVYLAPSGAQVTIDATGVTRVDTHVWPHLGEMAAIF